VGGLQKIAFRLEHNRWTLATRGVLSPVVFVAPLISEAVAPCIGSMILQGACHFVTATLRIASAKDSVTAG
jgi:hypothetical protein